jgi:tetraacyldisaccharide 4'-kinase
VLVSAERAADVARVLPAGPYRERLDALRRADVVVVTRKAATDAHVASALATVARTAPRVPVAVVSLLLDGVARWRGAPDESDAREDVEHVQALGGTSIVAVAAVGDPQAFFAQLAAVGARVAPLAFPDHHAFTPHDVAAIVERAAGASRVVCTLKDAVKLGPLWPRLASPLWYVSQRVAVERGGDVLDRMVARLLSARALPSEPSGFGRPS